MQTAKNELIFSPHTAKESDDPLAVRVSLGNAFHREMGLVHFAIFDPP